ncbi:VWA domain-containing protein [Halorubrum sp. Ea8]|uniref:VWA domain-containing protein n=1 Tax=Halorubrum sp. Ea8 TaxID=1383841 RepID=UPI000B97F687|nr:VWA domain-containing protein [Halorubrum sp. Ea8]OYR52563.1 VWA containing CoxE-like protein [Halorubrum sp. Ea8]
MARSDGTATETPDFPAAREHLLTELIRFVAVLRRDGVAVPASGALDAARAIAAVGLTDERRVEAALRASLLSETADGDPFAEAFPTFWHRLRSGLDRIATAHDGPSPESEEGDDGEDRTGDEAGPTAGSDADDAEEPGLLDGAEPPEMDADGDGDPTVRIPTDRRHAAGDRPTGEPREETDGRRYSAVGESALVEADVPAPSSADRAAAERFVDALSSLPGRRRRRSPTGPNVDARGALRASLQTGGAPIDLPRDAPTPSELRCCLLVDVSGSVLDTIDRSALLGLGERVAASARDARVFLFDTDLAEATAAFADPGGEPAEALRAAQIEWGGGTKIGGAFDALRRTAPHAVDRRTVVVVVSDGLDVGDPDLLTDGITWLADRADGVVWLNPLAVSPSFEPASRGMSDAAPYVDGLFGFAEGADLAEAARQIERRGLGGPVGYEHDPRRTGGAPGGGRGRTDDEARTGDAGEEGLV